MNYPFLKKGFALISLFLLLLGTISAQAVFQETSFSNAQLVIQEEQLPYIIYFYGSWCPSCQLMEETTFKDAKVKERIETNYVVFKVNADSERGKEWMSIYGVTSVPTTVFYSKEDFLLNKIESSMTPREFLKVTANFGELPPDSPLGKSKDVPSPKYNRTAKIGKKRINSAPVKSESKDLKSTLAAIDTEIEILRSLLGDASYKSKNNISRNQLNPKSYYPHNESTSFPSAETISHQIEACKSLLTGHKNIKRLIAILKDYKSILTPIKGQKVRKKEVVLTTKHPISGTPKVAKKVTNYQKLYNYNQQIISYLKLDAPVKEGNRYIVQIGKYQNIRNAERLVQKIQDKYDYPIKVHIQKQGELPVQVVYLGEFKTKSEAIAANENLKWINRKGVVKLF